MKKPLLLGIILTVCVVIVAFVFAQFYPEGMISYWKFDEAPGPTAFDSADANHGTINGATRTTGQVGGALSFDGFNDYVEVPDSGSLDITGPITLEAWILRTKANAWQGIVGKFSGELNKRSYLLYVSNGNKLALLISSTGLQPNPPTGGEWNYIFGTSVIPLNTWVHVMGTYDGSYLRVYINGSIDGEKAATIGPTYVSDAPLRIGIFTQGGYPVLESLGFGGKIDEVAIYSRALTAIEIQHHYQNGLNSLGYEEECVSPPDNMVSWWPGDIDARDIQDGNNGTLINGALAAVAGKVDGAFSFDGVDDFVTFGNIVGNFGTSDFTIDFWIKTTSTRIEGVLGKRPVCGHSSFFDIRMGGGRPQSIWGNLVIELDQAATNYNVIITNQKVNDGQFHHVAVVRQGSTVSVYIDGVLDVAGTTPGVTNIVNSSDFIAGKSTCTGIDGTNFFTGLLDELEVFNRALSSTEIQDIFLAGSAGKCKVIEVEIDIKPGSDPNSVNLGENGLLPVAILGSANFDVTTIVPGTIEIGGVSLALRGPAKKVQKLAYSYEDQGDDGNIDMMMVFFDVWKLVEIGVLKEGTTELLLTATLGDGTPIEGKDSVNIIHY